MEASYDVDLEYTTLVQARDEFGRFTTLLDAAAERTAEDLAEVALDAMEANAPVRTGAYKRSLFKRRLGEGKAWLLGSTHPAAKHIEEGAGAHQMERGGTTFMHPGSPAHRVLEAGRAAAHAASDAILRRNYQ